VPIARIEDQSNERREIAHLGRFVQGSARDDVGKTQATERELDERDGAPPSRQERHVAISHSESAAHVVCEGSRHEGLSERRIVTDQ
jgi:hypothetical protein